MTGAIKLAENTPQTELGFPIHVQVYIPQMQCVRLSSESEVSDDCDTICILFSGKTPGALEYGRLPRCAPDAGYYEYRAGRVNTDDDDWTNHEQAPLGRPMIWTGTLKNGEHAEFLVTIMRQHNQPANTSKQLLEMRLDAASATLVSNTTVGALSALVKRLPGSTNHNLIGAFAIQLVNVSSALQTVFVPIQGQMVPAEPDSPAVCSAGKVKNQAALFDCSDACGAQYRVIAEARIGPRLPVRTYIGKTSDRCGETLLAVEGGPGAYTGFYHVRKGRAVWIPITAPCFAWYCQTAKQSTAIPDGANLVYARRSAGADRQVTWYCYYEDEQSLRPAYKPNRTWVKLGAEIDQCGEHVLAIEGVGGFYHLTAGQQRWVPLRGRQFRWYRGHSPVCAIAPEETNLVLAKRSAPMNRIYWEYCREIVSLQPYANPDDTKVLLGHETDHCATNR